MRSNGGGPYHEAGTEVNGVWAANGPKCSLNYLPATAVTKAATSAALPPCSRPDGIRPCPVPPSLIALSTRAGVIVPMRSRSGPITPRAFTAASVWQLAQGARKRVLPFCTLLDGITVWRGLVAPAASLRLDRMIAGTATPTPA